VVAQFHLRFSHSWCFSLGRLAIFSFHPVSQAIVGDIALVVVSRTPVVRTTGTWMKLTRSPTRWPTRFGEPL
jgi:hypothetical protein